MALEQVFLYVTQHCNIRCVTCYALDQLERSDDLGFDDLVAVLRELRRQGAWRVSVLGGEPTVYRRLGDVAVAARRLGFTFVRVNTNGMFRPALLHDPRIKAIDVFCFSVDGSTADVNDGIRTGARLGQVTSNMTLARELGYDVRANVTITSRNMHQTLDIIRLVEACGGTEVNINVMFLMGYALDHRELAVAPAEWRRIYDEIVERAPEFKVRIKLPPAFARGEDLPAHRVNGHRCAAVDGTRVYASSNGDVYPCLTLMNDPARRIAAFVRGTLEPVSAAPDADVLHDYCHFVDMRSDGLYPLCLFYKRRLNA